ncbi:MAG: bifunctional hydroxymethylpyrimidine kinase/phosphomethylpyrimidine kinase [Clostridiales bacterium]|jgi:hydroxymethylpyrimidine/phosphomethylpyrimidine kinase|nr:bifunctional hydroxymethylpyrimidine kinase/phosphomethylpyrimidine kinase [Clostridiales bacterium]
MKKVLTVAGSDPSGGAGIQADIKTIAAHGLYAMSVITSLTAQNTLGVFGILDVDANFVKKQLDCVFADIYPDAVKIGMLSSESIIDAVAERLTFYKAKNIVFDPVMVATSGDRLLKSGDESALFKLFSSVSLITPNIPETEALCGFSVKNKYDMEKAAKALSKRSGCAVLVKGGHLAEDSLPDVSDCLYENNSLRWFSSPRIDNPNNHGTGCTLSSAIACNLAMGKGLADSVKDAKEYLTAALSRRLDIGQGRGPLFHNFNF